MTSGTHSRERCDIWGCQICGIEVTRYAVEVWKEREWWLARIEIGSGTCITQGKTKEELWMMIGDAVLAAEDVPLSWWNRIMHKFLIY